MPAPEPRHTILGSSLPSPPLPPTLLFHKWHGYDCFAPETYRDHRGRQQSRKPFERDETGRSFLRQVATSVQQAGRDHYDAWHRRFSRACGAVGCEPAVTVQTEWRMVVGWATNPAYETGITLDPLLGFPSIPGSAVKGLLHQVAEEQLRAVVPDPADSGGGAPPANLRHALSWALRVRALFGSLHLRPDGDDQPVSALVLLERWLRVARLAVQDEVRREGWAPVLSGLEACCSDAPTGGMVACFDGVPSPGSFAPGTDPLLQVDVLTPHPDSGPNPVLFLAVRDGARFELRLRLAEWPSGEPRDDEERLRSEAVAGLDRKKVLAQLRLWVLQGLEELGIGGKTSSGYGYLYPPRNLPRRPPPLQEPASKEDPAPELPPAEAEAVRRLPEGIDGNRATDILDNELREQASEVSTAIVRRFESLFPELIAKWASQSAPAKVKRLRLMREALGEEEAER